MVALEDVWKRIETLAVPGEPIEISLSEAVGLVLAEPVIADVDLPAFDRAASEGYAVKASEATPGAFLRVIAPPASVDGEFELEAGESAFVALGGALPLRADSVLAADSVRSEAGSSGPRVIEVIQGAATGRSVSTRGTLARAGQTLVPAGTRVTPAMVGLLASQGCVHPICHRRVRVSVLAIGDQLVGPAEAPILHRERNATNLAVSALILAKGAMVHDLGCVSDADAAPAIDRATTAPVVIIIGDFTGGLLRRLARDGVEPIASGLDLSPGAGIQYGVMRDERGFPTAHLLLLPLDPVAAVIGTALLALPLIARLQGGTETGPTLQWARLKGGYASREERTLALPARLLHRDNGVLETELVPLAGERDLPGFARANALVLIDAGATVDPDGLVRVVPLGVES